MVPTRVPNTAINKKIGLSTRAVLNEGDDESGNKRCQGCEGDRDLTRDAFLYSSHVGHGARRYLPRLVRVKECHVSTENRLEVGSAQGSRYDIIESDGR